MKKIIKFVVVAFFTLLIINKIPEYLGGKYKLYDLIQINMSSDIKKIRNGHLDGTTKVTIAEALEGYFSSPKWGTVAYYDIECVVFQGEYREDGKKRDFQMLFPKYSDYEEYGMEDQLELDAIPIMDTFINRLPDENKGKELLMKAYAASGEELKLASE